MSNQKLEIHRSQQGFPNKKHSMCVFSRLHVTRSVVRPHIHMSVRSYVYGRRSYLSIVRSYVRSYTFRSYKNIVPHLVPHEALNEALFLYDRKPEYIF